MNMIIFSPLWFCKNKKYKLFAQVPPFLQEATNSSNSTAGGGGGQYEGYIVDLLDEITSHLCVSYEISLAADGKFGSQNGDDWTGIIGDVVNGVILNAKFNRAFASTSASMLKLLFVWMVTFMFTQWMSSITFWCIHWRWCSLWTRLNRDLLKTTKIKKILFSLNGDNYVW